MNERCRTLATRIVVAIGASIAGRNIAAAYPELRSVNNFAAVIQIVNQAVNRELNADSGARGETSSEHLQRVLEQLDEIGDCVQSEIEERLSVR